MKSKLPKSYRLYVFKARWNSTAVLLKIIAQDWIEAYDKAYKMARRRDGGDTLIDVILVNERNI